MADWSAPPADPRSRGDGIVPSVTQFDSYGTSHQGRVRTRNEDGYLVEPGLGLWLVADGMGGHDAGDLASASIVQHLSAIGAATSARDLRARFEEGLGRAHAQIQAIASERRVTIGSTVAALLARDGAYACLWAGDSRIYLVRGGEISQVSRDHTEVQELLDRGAITAEEADSWPRRNVITRAVGVHEDVVLEAEQGAVHPSDTFVLCTDGLTAHVSDTEIEAAVLALTPSEACEALVSKALDRGGKDNVTVVIVRARKTA